MNTADIENLEVVVEVLNSPDGEEPGDADVYGAKPATESPAEAVVTVQPTAAPSDVDSDLPGADKLHVSGDPSACASDTSSGVALAAPEPAAGSDVAGSVGPKATVEPARKPSKVAPPTRAPWMVSKAERKRSLDAIQEDDSPARWFDDEIAAQAKKIARAEAKKAAKLKAH